MRPTRVARIERAVGVLEDHLEVSPQAAQGAAAKREEVLASKPDLSGVGPVERHDQACQG